MRWLAVVVLLGACGNHTPPVVGGVSLVLDIPNGVLDPKGFTTVEVVLHEPSGDIVRSAKVNTDGTFDLGALDPSPLVSIEATLRSDSGAAVGYGRTSADAAFAGGSQIVVPVRRPIAYIAGTVSLPNPQTNVLSWSEAPATISDLSTGTPLDGSAQLGSQVVLMVAAGPSLYMITQAITPATGALTGPATVTPISTADHKLGTALTGQLTGEVVDGAGTDDGTKLAVATKTQLFAIDTASGTATALANGSFARVAILTTDTGEIDVIAIKNRGTTTDSTCATSAELWWAPLTGGTGAAHMVATGGFADIATDRGRAYYVDACTGALGELTAMRTSMLRSITTSTSGRPTALAVSNGQAYVGVENQPGTTSLLVAATAATATSDAPRTLWTESAQQVADVVSLPEVQRQLDATSVEIKHLEVGAGGDYVALTTKANFHGALLSAVSFPDMTVDSEELRVFDASSGGNVQRYRSWCDGVLIPDPGVITDWECALAAGQTAPPSTTTWDHRINSMTFLFGKK